MSVTHEMVMARQTESGAQEWQCPVCGRLMVLRSPPYSERTVLVPGDETVNHVGGRSGFRNFGVEQPEARLEVVEEDLRWLSRHGIAWEREAA